MRQDPPLEPGIQIERAGSIVRAVGRFNCILSHLTPENAEAAIDEQRNHFRNAGTGVEWKVMRTIRRRSADRLAAAGFIADDSETPGIRPSE